MTAGVGRLCKAFEGLVTRGLMGGWNVSIAEVGAPPPVGT